MKKKLFQIVAISTFALFTVFNISQSFSEDKNLDTSLGSLIVTSKAAADKEIGGDVTGPLYGNEAGTEFYCGCTNQNSCGSVCKD